MINIEIDASRSTNASADVKLDHLFNKVKCIKKGDPLLYYRKPKDHGIVYYAYKIENINEESQISISLPILNKSQFNTLNNLETHIAEYYNNITKLDKCLSCIC